MDHAQYYAQILSAAFGTEESVAVRMWRLALQIASRHVAICVPEEEGLLSLLAREELALACGAIPAPRPVFFEAMSDRVNRSRSGTLPPLPTPPAGRDGAWEVRAATSRALQVLCGQLALPTAPNALANVLWDTVSLHCNHWSQIAKWDFYSALSRFTESPLPAFNPWLNCQTKLHPFLDALPTDRCRDLVRELLFPHLRGEVSACAHYLPLFESTSPSDLPPRAFSELGRLQGELLRSAYERLAVELPGPNRSAYQHANLFLGYQSFITNGCAAAAEPFAREPGIGWLLTYQDSAGNARMADFIRSIDLISTAYFGPTHSLLGHR